MCKKIIMELFDSHFHYHDNQNDFDMEEYYANTQRDNKIALMTVGANFESSLIAQQFAESFPKSYFAVGVHPHSADEFFDNPDDFSIFKNHKKLKAIGELGLDYFYDYSDNRNQIRVFEEFLELALSWNLPAIIHCRDKDNSFKSYFDCYNILKDFSKSRGEFVVHCYSGNQEYLEKFLSIGSYIGVTGMVTFNKATNIRENLPLIPINRLLIETDSPYLAPIPFRGKENRPEYVYYVADKIAKELGMTTEEVAKITTKNAQKLFKIKVK